MGKVRHDCSMVWQPMRPAIVHSVKRFKRCWWFFLWTTNTHLCHWPVGTVLAGNRTVRRAEERQTHKGNREHMLEGLRFFTYRHDLHSQCNLIYMQVIIMIIIVLVSLSLLPLLLWSVLLLFWLLLLCLLLLLHFVSHMYTPICPILSAKYESNIEI